jgi:hypothetical protein
MNPMLIVTPTFSGNRFHFVLPFLIFFAFIAAYTLSAAVL